MEQCLIRKTMADRHIIKPRNVLVYIYIYTPPVAAVVVVVFVEAADDRACPSLRGTWLSQTRSSSGVLKTCEPRVWRSKKFVVDQRKGLLSSGAVVATAEERYGPTFVAVPCVYYTKRSSTRRWRHGPCGGGGLLRASRLLSEQQQEQERKARERSGERVGGIVSTAVHTAIKENTTAAIPRTSPSTHTHKYIHTRARRPSSRLNRSTRRQRDPRTTWQPARQ